MKIELNSDKIIIYLYNHELHIDNIPRLNEEIKDLFVNLIKRYDIDFYGYSKVSIYNNKKYGNILEIEKICHSEFNMSIVDLKIIVYKDVSMYFEFDDWYFEKIPRNILIKNNKYYLNLNDINEIEKYIEYGRINYNSIV